MDIRGLARVALLMAMAVAAAACDFPVLQVVAPTPTPTRRPAATPTAPPAASAAVNDLEAQVEGVYRQAGPAVVNVTSQVLTYDFFMQAVPQEGTGSGFLYDREGHVVTNYHVVEGAESVTVAFASGDEYDAEIVGTDPSTDLAVLRVQAQDLPAPLPLADSAQLRVGQFVVAIGNPFRLDRTLTLGVISALQRVIESPDGRFIGEAIQTDAAINPGNSGGPLLDLHGQVIGVNSQIVGATGANVGIGFAIASNTVRRVVPELISRGRYPHPWLGVNLLGLSAEISEVFRQAGMQIPVEQGLLVIEVVRGGPAYNAGIRGGSRVVNVSGVRVPIGGDIITAIDGQSVTNSQELIVYLESQTRVGETVQVDLVREGEAMTLPLTLGELPTD